MIYTLLVTHTPRPKVMLPSNNIINPFTNTCTHSNFLLPQVVGFLPITIDTPNNRAAMPDADYGAWTTTEEVRFTVRFRAHS